MAAAAREGQAWFLKSSLKSPGYDGSKQEDFYSWMLLEVVYNATEDEANAVAPRLRYPGHPRTGQQDFFGTPFSAGYGRYQYMTAMYGPSAEDIKRTYRISSNISRGQLWRQTGSAAVCYIAVPLPTAKERFIWVDLTYPVRAFYIPCAFTAHPQYKEHAIFSRLDVRGRKGMPPSYVIKGLAASDIAAGKKVVDSWNETYPHNWRWRKEAEKIVEVYDKLVKRVNDLEAGPDREGPALQEPGLTSGYVKPDGKAPSQVYAKINYAKDAVGDETTGWGMRPQWTVRIDIFKLACQLLIPYSQRTDEYRNVYACFTLFERRVVHASKITADIDMAQAIDLAQAQSKELGVRLQYEKDEPDDKFIKDLFVGFVAVGLGLIPVIGPLVAFGWSLGYEILSDSEKFTKAAGVGGKAPAFTQAVVDSRETLLPMIKKGVSSMLKMHMQARDKRSIRVDPSEEDNNADGSSQQQSEKANDGEEKPEHDPAVDADEQPQQQPESGDSDEKPGNDGETEQEGDKAGDGTNANDNEGAQQQQPENGGDDADKPDTDEKSQPSPESGNEASVDEGEKAQEQPSSGDDKKPDDDKKPNGEEKSGGDEQTDGGEKPQEQEPDSGGGSDERPNDEEKPGAEDKSDSGEKPESDEKPDAEENTGTEEKLDSDEKQENDEKPESDEKTTDDEKSTPQEQFDNDGKETDESQTKATDQDSKTGDENKKTDSKPTDEKEETDSFRFIIEAGEADVVG